MPITWRRRLHPHFPVLYAGSNGRVAHECILDLRPTTRATGITAEDVAKRLADYGFHAPTLSFPVRRDSDGRADRKRGDRGTRPILRRDDLDPERDRPGRVGGVVESREPLRMAPHPAAGCRLQ